MLAGMNLVAIRWMTTPCGCTCLSCCRELQPWRTCWCCGGLLVNFYCGVRRGTWRRGYTCSLNVVALATLAGTGFAAQTPVALTSSILTMILAHASKVSAVHMSGQMASYENSVSSICFIENLGLCFFNRPWTHSDWCCSERMKNEYQYGGTVNSIACQTHEYQQSKISICEFEKL